MFLINFKTSDVDGVSRIITATSTEFDKISIGVWTLKSPKAEGAISRSQRMAEYFIALTIQVVMLAATMAYIWQNYGDKVSLQACRKIMNLFRVIQLNLGSWLRQTAATPVQGNDLSIIATNSKLADKRFSDKNIEFLKVMVKGILQMVEDDMMANRRAGGRRRAENVILL